MADGLVEAFPALDREAAWSVVVALNMGTELINMEVIWLLSRLPGQNEILGLHRVCRNVACRHFSLP